MNALQFKNSFEKNIEHITSAFDVTVITQSRDDLEMAELYKREYGVRTYSYHKTHELHKLLRLYAKQDLVITQRFHGMVYSMMIGVPVIVLGYHGQKQHKFLSDLGFAKRLLAYHEPKKLEHLLHHLSLGSKELSKVVVKITDKQRSDLREQALQNQKMLCETLSQ